MNDTVVLKTPEGQTLGVAWLQDVPLDVAIQTVLLPRLPANPQERAWVYGHLTVPLVPGGSVRFVGPSLHA